MEALIKTRRLRGPFGVFSPAPAPSLGAPRIRLFRQGRDWAPKLRNQQLEPLNRAASADTGVDRVTSGAETRILGLQIEIAVEVERRAVLIELGADPCAIGQNEIDLLWSGKEGAADGADGDAFRALLLDPDDLLHERSRLDRTRRITSSRTTKRVTDCCMTPGCAAKTPSSIGMALKMLAGDNLWPALLAAGFAAKP